MPRRRKAQRQRIGQVSIYPHNGSWWLYYRQNGRQVRRRVAAEPQEARKVAAQINAQLVTNAPTLFEFAPIHVADVRQKFLEHHEQTIRSSVATIDRYRTATQHLINFVLLRPVMPKAHEVNAEEFVAYLRSIRVAPNGHPNTAKRPLRDKGIQFILETCRALYHFAAKRRHLPPYASNPFETLPIYRMKIQNAKPVFVFDAEQELAFLLAASPWEFAIHFTLAKTGLRIGEIAHLLIEDVDLDRAWLNIRNKSGLGWRIKTGAERRIPLMSELVAVLRRVIAGRRTGPVFLRQRYQPNSSTAVNGSQFELERLYRERIEGVGRPLSRTEELQIAKAVWHDAGAVKNDAVRTSFVRVMRKLGQPQATCPKSWRHTFATLLQDANVDPLVRQITLGHAASSTCGLGMTTHYTHTRPETHRQQIEEALRRWPESLALGAAFAKGVNQ